MAGVLNRQSDVMFSRELQPSRYSASTVDVNGEDWSVTQSAGSIAAGERTARVIEPVGCH